MAYWSSGKMIEIASLLAVMAVISVGIILGWIKPPPEITALIDLLSK